VQTPQFILTLRLVFIFLPVVLITFGIYFASRFPLSVERHRRLEAILEQARNGESVNENEKRQLTKLLIG